MRYLNSIKQKLSALLAMWLLIMLVAIWSVVIQDGHINRDGLMYLKQAFLIVDGSWNAGLAIYPWPFFSILIAIFHKITGLHLQVAAHTVDLSLFGIATLFYLKTLNLIYKQKYIIFYGGIILLSFIPIMDDYVGMVLRDHGFWAGCMMGTYFYFKSVQTHSLKNSISWQFGFLLAGLFRPEGLVFLLILPLWNLLHSRQQRVKQLLQDYGLLITLSIVVLVGVLSSRIDIWNILNSTRLVEFIQRPLQFLLQLAQPLPLKSSNHWLSKLLEDFNLLITYSLLISILIFKWLKGLGMLHGGLLVYHFLYSKKNDYRKSLYFFLAVSFILVSVNLFTVYVLANRYWIFHWWWVFILITPILLNLIESKKSNLLIKFSLDVIILLSIACSLIDQSDNLEQEIAEYIRQNQLANIEFSDSHRIGYYVNYDISDLIKKPSKKNIN